MNAILKIRTSEETGRAWRVLCAELGATQGKVIAALVHLVRTGQLSHEHLGHAVTAAAELPLPGFVIEDPEDHLRYLRGVGAAARQCGDLNLAYLCEVKAAKIRRDAEQALPDTYIDDEGL